MKHLHSFVVVGLLLALLSNHATANDVIVKGYLKFLNGSPVVNQQVSVSIDSAVSTCRQTKLVATDHNGFYTASLNCSSNFARVIISTANCNGTHLVETPQVPPSGIVEKNFSICNPPPPSLVCKAYFRFEKLPGTNSIRFNSDSSTGGSSTDNIVKRRWRFGDGNILEGNEIKPLHTYTSKGTYEVCLTIVTASGCEKTLCQKVIIEDPSNTLCKAEFSFHPSTSNYKEIKFNSANSIAGAGDQIISRRWLFGDGKEATTVDPVHVYDQDGAYRVCLIIKTLAGCVKEICQTIEIKPRKCEAYFGFSVLPSNSSNGYPVHFNSLNSSSNDSIVSRKWIFGDGTTATTLDPLHVYTQPGTYRVCLVIKTKNGCESEICKQIVVGPNAPSCSGHFNFERLHPKTIRFNSNMSWGAVGDEVVSRKWDFGDGSPVLTGNQVSVVKEYNRPGNYTVCLSIKTAKGCENKVCISVRIEDSTTRPASEPAIKIVTLYPAPVRTRMTTEVWSRYNNVEATLAVYDIYGVKKWQVKKVLLQGVNVSVVETGSLLPGPYFFKVTTMYGVVSKQFYKL